MLGIIVDHISALFIEAASPNQTQSLWDIAHLTSQLALPLSSKAGIADGASLYSSFNQ